jgi:hypothetical protein
MSAPFIAVGTVELPGAYEAVMQVTQRGPTLTCRLLWCRDEQAKAQGSYC